MNLKGFSGCGIELINGDRVKKISSSPKYNSRLKKQKEKQINFSSELPFLSSPKVFSSRKNSFEMEYIKGKDFISFLSEGSRSEIDDFANMITLYISEAIDNCNVKKIEKEIFEKKILEIYKKRKILTLIEFIEMLPDHIRIPVGSCHGDLTLSNVIFKKNKIVLIDFLDSYIETPLIDMAKIRQDTCYKWSLNLYEKKFDKNKIKISLDYLDSVMHKSFSKIPSYRKYYYYFQFINLARILPYAKGFKKINYLRDRLSDIITKI